MNIILCLDDKNGILFNNRRQSRDVLVIDRILQVAENKTLLMNEYSSKIFPNDKIIVNNNFLEIAKSGDYCFIENVDIGEYKDKIEKIIIYRWNRVYPADKKIDSSLIENKKLITSYEFKGNSHEKITEDIYDNI